MRAQEEPVNAPSVLNLRSDAQNADLGPIYWPFRSSPIMLLSFERNIRLIENLQGAMADGTNDEIQIE